MKLDTSHELNKKVLQYLGRGKKKEKPLIAPPDSVDNPYFDQGSHPEIVERVWDEIGSSLPTDCRCLIYGTPALVHPTTGIIFVFCNGTTYCMRLTPAMLEEALKAGARTYTKWTYGGDMDTQGDLGSDWVFGGWLDGEVKWCNKVYEKVGNLLGENRVYERRA